jgi:hypothetical protein
LRLLDLALHFYKRRKFLIICGFIWVMRSELARVIVVISNMILYALLLISLFEHICWLPFMSVYLMWRNTLYFSLHSDENLNSSLTSSFQPRCGPRVDSASKRSGVKGGRCVELTFLPTSYADYIEIIRASTSSSLRGQSRPL